MINKSPVIALALLYLLCFSGDATRAQNLLPGKIAQDDTPPVRILEKSGSEELDRVERLIRLGEYQRAADLLEMLYEKNPDDMGIKNLLATCYEQTKNYDKMVLFLKQRLAAEPPGYQLFKALGRAYVLSGHSDSATTFFYEAVKLAPDNIRAYTSIAEEYHKLGHYRLEMEFIDSSRVLTGDPTLLSDRMGDALAAQKKYGPASLEYLTFMNKDTLATKIATEKLEALMRFPESADTVMAILSERIKTHSDNQRLLNIYGWMLMEQDRYDEAFSFFKSRDSLDSGQGGDIVHFMRECNRRGRFEYTLLGGQYFMDHLSRSTLKNSAAFEMAEAMIATGQHKEALALYQSISDDFIRPAHRAESILKIGLLYKDHLKDFGSSRQHLSQVIQIAPGGRYDLHARFALADLEIKEGALDSALSRYQSLQQWDLPEEIREQVEFALAEINMFQGNYEEAVTGFRQIISRYPRGFYVNDAIQYSLILGEAMDEAAAHMDLFSAAEYFRYTQQSDSMEYYLDKICRVEIPSLAPISYLRLAQLYFEQKRYDEAVASIDSLVSNHKSSYFLPYGLKLKADICLLSSKTRQQAMDLYRSLLEDYATYPFAAEIRDIIRHQTPAGQI